MYLRFGLLSALLLACPVFAQQQDVLSAGQPEPGADLAAEPPPGAFSHERLEPVVDGIMAGLFQAHHLAGSVVTIVKDGQILFAKGYGYADLEARRPVDPATSLFRIASVSKLFTWTAVMQLVEDGKLQLNRDVNEYLSQVKVPATYQDPVTLAALMTHTAGFEDRVLGLVTSVPAKAVPFGQILEEGLPSRVRPPGRVPAYSNYGAALAALVVQDASGMPWSQVIQTRILDPLEMTHTFVVQPPPADASGDLSQGYSFVNGALARQPFEFVPLLPAGGMSATGDDIAHFMLAHLNLGQYDGHRILEESTARQMEAPLYRPDPRIPGLAHGFFLTRRDGQLIVGHLGDLRCFHSALALVPSRRLGVFISFNSEEGDRARDEFIDALFDYAFPQDEAEPIPPDPGAEERAASLTGVYRSTRRPVTTVDRFVEVMRYVTVSNLGGGRLKTTGAGESPRQWYEVEPYFYREHHGQDTLLFQMDSEDAPARAFFSKVPFFAFERMRWYQEPGFQLTLLAVEVLVFLTTLVFPFIRRYVERSGDRMLARREPDHPVVRALASSLSLVDLSFLVGLILVFRDPGVVLAGVPPGLSVVLILPLIGGVLTVMLLVVTFFAWRGGYWYWTARLHFSLVTVAALLFLWQASYWNLLGWQYS
jgi:CubicO group peptidase (beta-lactamase class C family)